MMDGDIWVTSNADANKGTDFTFRVYLHNYNPADWSTPPPMPISLPIPEFSLLKVVIIDDHPLNIKSAYATLSRCGVQELTQFEDLITFENAISNQTNSPLEFHCVLIDFRNIVNRNQIPLLENLIQRYPNRIIVLSTTSLKKILWSGNHGDSLVYAQRPVKLNVLVDFLNQIVNLEGISNANANYIQSSTFNFNFSSNEKRSFDIHSQLRSTPAVSPNYPKCITQRDLKHSSSTVSSPSRNATPDITEATGRSLSDSSRHEIKSSSLTLSSSTPFLLNPSITSPSSSKQVGGPITGPGRSIRFVRSKLDHSKKETLPPIKILLGKPFFFFFFYWLISFGSFGWISPLILSFCILCFSFNLPLMNYFFFIALFFSGG